MTSVVRPFISSSSASCTFSWLSSSRALVASSRSRIGGSARRARAIAIRCFSPPLTFEPSAISVRRPCGNLSLSIIESYICAARSASCISAKDGSLTQPNVRFSLIVNFGTNIGSWATDEI
mmetsp:Transcript_23420/g.42018  ORF Transcript_23420/g.42018 Transcript_23420/m.42018 type:complete len:121 (-) Transcript_23420:2034-2396(-)